MSIRCSGAASRSFIIGSRLCPPAITRASGPKRSSSASASSTLVARAYSKGAGELLRLAATSLVSEFVASPLLGAFLRRSPGTEVSVQVEPEAYFAALLEDRLVDVTLGPRLDAAIGIESVPFLRYRMIVVAAPRHRLAARRQIPPAALAGEQWLGGPSGAAGEPALAALPAAPPPTPRAPPPLR